MTNIRGEFYVPNETGVTLYCPKCLRKYDGCSAKSACFCACDRSGPTQLRSERELYVVNEVSTRFFIMNNLFVRPTT